MVFDWGGWIRDGVGTRGVGEKKKILFDRNTLEHALWVIFCSTSLEPDKRVQREGLFGQQTEPHVRSQCLEISMKKIKEIKITHYCHYDKNRPKIPLCLNKYSPPRHYKEINPTTIIMIKIGRKYLCV